MRGYDNWKTTNPDDEFLGDQHQSGDVYAIYLAGLGMTETTCPKCGSTDIPSIVSGMGLRATCRCGFSGGLHEFAA